MKERRLKKESMLTKCKVTKIKIFQLMLCLLSNYFYIICDDVITEALMNSLKGSGTCQMKMQ